MRTINQNNAMHKYFTLLSESLNDAGLDVRRTMREDIDIPWTPSLVKELIWRKVQVAMFEIESTTKLEADEVSKVYEVINRHIAQSFGVSVEFPSKGD